MENIWMAEAANNSCGWRAVKLSPLSCGRINDMHVLRAHLHSSEIIFLLWGQQVLWCEDVYWSFLQVKTKKKIRMWGGILIKRKLDNIYPRCDCTVPMCVLKGQCVFPITDVQYSEGPMHRCPERCHTADGSLELRWKTWIKGGEERKQSICLMGIPCEEAGPAVPVQL